MVNMVLCNTNRVICCFRNCVFTRDFRLICCNLCFKRRNFTDSAACFIHQDIRSVTKVPLREMRPACHYCTSSTDRITSPIPANEIKIKDPPRKMPPILAAQLEKAYSEQSCGKLVHVRAYRFITDMALQYDSITKNQVKCLLLTISSPVVPLPMSVRYPDLPRLWQHLTDIGIPFDVDTYNVRLQAYGRMGELLKLSVVEEIESMKQHGINPNYVTYSHFMKIYCEVGDMDGARENMQLMKDLGLKITIDHFNSIIRGQFIAGDIEMAIKMYDFMECYNVERNSFTYGEMMVGFARHLDIDNVIKMIETALDDATTIPQQFFRQTLQILITDGHYDVAKKLFSVFPKRSLTIDSRDLLVDMLDHGQFQLAVETYRYMKAQRMITFVLAAATSKISVNDFVVCMRLLLPQFHPNDIAAACNDVANLRKPDRQLVYLEVLRKMKLTVEDSVDEDNNKLLERKPKIKTKHISTPAVSTPLM